MQVSPRPHGLAAARPETVARVLEGDDLSALAAGWDRLALNALEENPFFARDYVLAAHRTIGDPAKPRALCVFRREAGGADRLVGLLPFESARFRYGVPLDVGVVPQNLFQTSGTPLIDRDCPDEAVDGLLDALRAGGGIAQNVLIPNLRHGGPVARLLSERGGERGLEADFVGRLRRPILRLADEDAASYLRRAVSPKRLRELGRARRRLGECGSLSYRHVTHPGELRAATEDFLRIEASGWKGKGGTAFLSRPETAAFARAAFSGRCDGAPIVSADVLALDGTAVAACVNLQIGRTSFAVKCAYDEEYRRFSPGLVLEHLVVEQLFGTRFADEIDSCVTEEGHVIGELWDGTADVGTLALRPSRSRLLGFGPVGLDLPEAERRRSLLRAQAKQIYLGARSQMSANVPPAGAPRVLQAIPQGRSLAVAILAVV